MQSASGNGVLSVASCARFCSTCLNYVCMPDRQEDELRITAEQLAIVRRARMTELYAADREEYALLAAVLMHLTLNQCDSMWLRRWQRQLALKGLTIEPLIR